MTCRGKKHSDYMHGKNMEIMLKAPRIILKPLRIIAKASRIMLKPLRIMAKAPRIMPKVPPYIAL